MLYTEAEVSGVFIAADYKVSETTHYDPAEFAVAEVEFDTLTEAAAWLADFKTERPLIAVYLTAGGDTTMTGEELAEYLG